MLLGAQVGAAGGVQGEGRAPLLRGHETGRLGGTDWDPTLVPQSPWSDTFAAVHWGLHLPGLPVRGAALPPGPHSPLGGPHLGGNVHH